MFRWSIWGHKRGKKRFQGVGTEIVQRFLIGWIGCNRNGNEHWSGGLMGFLQGNFRDLTGEIVGVFTVQRLVGRDAAGAPKWEVRCEACTACQVVPHAKLAPMIASRATNLQCINPDCVNYRSHGHTQTLADVRREERKQAEQDARQAVEEQRKVQEAAAKNARLAAVRDEYRKYYVHQLGTPIDYADIVSFDRWRQLVPETRRMVLKRLEEDATVYFRGL